MAEKKCTAIVAYEVSHEDRERFLDSWKRANDFLRKQPGFESTALHQASSANPDFRFVNIAYWKDEDAFRNAIQSPDYQSARARLDAFPVHGAFYEVVTT